MSFLCSKLLQTICPCFFKQRNNFAQFGDNELIEQQQFISPESVEYDFDIKHTKRQFINSNEERSNERLQSVNGDTTRQSSGYLSRSQEQRSRQQEVQGSISPSQLITKEQIFMDYTDTINADHPYYDILLPKLQSLPSIFDIDQKYLLQTTESPFPLRLYCKHSEVRKTNIFIYSFIFDNTTYEQYESLINNFDIQKSFDSNINEYYKKMQSPNNDTKVVYLSYNKVLIVAPRDFIYVRYVFKKGQQFWSISTSIPNEPQTQGKIRGEIVLTATKVVQKNNQIHVNVYSQVNMKMAIKPEMAKNRGKTQIKKYLQKCHNYLTSNKSENIL